MQCDITRAGTTRNGCSLRHIPAGHEAKLGQPSISDPSSLHVSGPMDVCQRVDQAASYQSVESRKKTRRRPEAVARCPCVSHLQTAAYCVCGPALRLPIDANSLSSCVVCHDGIACRQWHKFHFQLLAIPAARDHSLWRHAVRKGTATEGKNTAGRCRCSRQGRLDGGQSSPFNVTAADTDRSNICRGR